MGAGDGERPGEAGGEDPGGGGAPGAGKLDGRAGGTGAPEGPAVGLLGAPLTGVTGKPADWNESRPPPPPAPQPLRNSASPYARCTIRRVVFVDP
ncbi:MAG: hypothetical protein ACREQ5_13230 [Candidatus Dormibacteria bacterium]